MPKNKFENSFTTLKQTIPLLIKHKISAEPINYALWYTYVSNDSQQLKDALDQATEQGRPISTSKARELYRNYLSEKHEVDSWQLRQSLEAMLIELNQSLTDTQSTTHSFKTTMDNCLDGLAKVEKEGLTIEEVMSLVRNMVKETQHIRKTTLGFSATLNSAEEEIKSLRAQLQESQKDALYDALTGLYNRRYFDDELKTLLGQVDFSLLLVDLDHFKKINDNHGHLLGDLVLKSVARKLQTGCRDGAQAFRYGGEEFAIILPNTNLTVARQIADVMRRSIERMNVKDRRTGVILEGITASVGVAQMQKNMGAMELIEQADKQLYEAKRLGRNRVMPIV
jgi:diguanylate cyclase